MSGHPSSNFSRREFIGLTLGGLLLAACGNRSPKTKIPGKIISSGSELGHMFRDHKFPAPVRHEYHRIVVIGGGVAGLSACRALVQSGIDDFLLLELENELGGNAVSGKNPICSFPWAAHYLPLPNPGLTELNKFLEESKIILGYNEKNLPVIDEAYLCFAPHERLFINGYWQNELTPEYGLMPAERAEMTRFLKLAEEYRNKTGQDGKPAFAIPLDRSSQDEELRRLDKISMADFLKERHFTSPYLLWYLNYCCNDDYGTSLKETSAWAGLHYFSSRKGVAANAESGTVITWPEGNAFLSGKLKSFSENKSRRENVVFSAEVQEKKVLLQCYDHLSRTSYTIEAEKVICATPQFVRARMFNEPVPEVSYSPWMVANLSVTDWPEGMGQTLSWDNVICNSKSLGYVDACHQLIRKENKERVLTFYFPFTDATPDEARKLLRSMDHEQLTSLVLEELKKAHADAGDHITNIDIRTWGHAMVRPTPGYIWGEKRQKLKAPVGGKVFFAHSDLSGISIFEEAFYNGLRAAEELIATLA